MRYAVRLLLRTPLFSAVAIVTLALGLGANTAIFTLVDALLLRPLPYRNPNALVMIWQSSKQYGGIKAVAPANLGDWKNRASVFEDIAYSWDNAYTVTGNGEALSVPGYQFSDNFFTLLGVTPFLGRTFLPGEGSRGREHVVVLSYRLWQSRFAADRNVIGRSVTMDGKPYTVIGVMPPEFAHPPRSALWTPLALDAGMWNNRHLRVLRTMARLKPGVTLEQAQTEINAISAQMEREFPADNAGWSGRLQPVRDLYVGAIRPSLVVLQAAVLFMLLIACANIASLILARSSARQKEISIRLALGAGQAQLLRQFLCEALLLAIPGTALGALTAWSAVRAFPALLPASLAETILPARALPSIDASVLLFLLGASLFAALSFGVAPVLEAASGQAGPLQNAGRGATAARRAGTLRNALIVAQVALSLVLLTGAGLMVRSLTKLQARDFGFRTDRILTLMLTLAPSRYHTTVQSANFIEQVVSHAKAVPGVESAAAVNGAPLTGMSNHRTFSIPGLPPALPGQDLNAELHIITPDYFRVMGIRLLKGRSFRDSDRLGAAGAAIIGESLARRFWPAEDPIGKHIRFADGGTPESREIVGVAADTLPHGLASERQFEIYRPCYQAYWPVFHLAVHTSQDPLQAAKSIQQAIWAVDPDEPVSGVETMEQLARDSLLSRRVMVNLLACFSVLALFLACLGIYGVIADSVKQRTVEIGIRMALGAAPRNVLGSVLSLGIRLALIGVVLGAASAAAVTRYLRSLLFGVSPLDPVTFAGVAVLLIGVAVAAAWIPARTAVKIDPMAALRWE